MPQKQMSLAERVLGVASIDPPDVGFTKAYHTLTGRTVAAADLVLRADQYAQQMAERRKLGRSYREAGALDVETIEEGITLESLYKLFYDRKLSAMTRFRLWPLYKQLYTENTDRGETVPDAKALRLGSMSALAAAAFAACCQDVLRAEPITIDTRTSEAKRRHGKIVLGNALAMPDEWAGTMSSVESGLLLPMLVDTQGRLAEPAQERRAMGALLRQVHKVLRPGGRLVMCEMPPRFDLNDLSCETSYNQDLMADFTETLGAELEESGFSNTQIDQGWEIDDVAHIFDPTQNYPAYEPTTLPRTRTVVATKS